MFNLKKIWLVAILALLVVAVAGCASLSNPLTAQSNKAVDYGNAFANNIKQDPGENSHVVSSSVTANGSDGARISITVQNDTKNKSSLWSNGTMVTYALNVQKYATTSDASNGYADKSFGLTTIPPHNVTNGSLNAVSPYKTVMGHDPSTVVGAMKIGNFNWVSADVLFAAQTDEFVMWGTLSMTAADQSTSPAPATAQATASLSPTSMPSIIPTPMPLPTATPLPTYQVSISGPTSLRDGDGGTWTVTVLANGVPVPQSDLVGKVSWYIDNHLHYTNGPPGTPPDTLITDANGSETTWAGYGAHTLTVDCQGYGSASITVTHVKG